MCCESHFTTSQEEDKSGYYLLNLRLVKEATNKLPIELDIHFCVCGWLDTGDRHMTHILESENDDIYSVKAEVKEIAALAYGSWSNMYHGDQMNNHSRDPFILILGS